MINAFKENFLVILWRNRNLLWQLSIREFRSRYIGSFIGVTWSVLFPLLVLTVYNFVFSGIFKTKWGDGTVADASFTIVLFVGLITYNLLSETISRAPQTIVNNASYVKKIIFPVEILPCIALVNSIFSAFINYLILLLMQLVWFGGLKVTAFLYPMALLPLVFIIAGLSWFLSATGVFVRDLGYIVNVGLTLLLFLSPVFYPISSIPENVRWVFMINPLTPVIEYSRDLIVYGRPINWTAFSLFLVLSLILSQLGFWYFRLLRRGFADVL